MSNILHRIGQSLAVIRTGINLIGTDAAKLDDFIAEITAEAEALGATDPAAARGAIQTTVDEAVSAALADAKISLNASVENALASIDDHIATAVSAAIAKLPAPPPSVAATDKPADMSGVA